MTKEEGMELLLEAGVDPEEALKILESKSGELVTKGLQLPGQDAARLIAEISKFGLFSGPMRFFVLISKDNEQRLLDLLSSTGKEPIIGGEFATSDMGKDPIGDYARQISDGFSGSAEFEGINPKLVN